MANVGATTLGAVTLAAQQRADMVNSTFITAAEWTNMVNASLQHLYEKLIEAYGSDYEVQTPSSITTDGVNDKYALPTDFFKHLGTDISIAGQWRTVWRFNFSDRNRYSLAGVPTALGRTNIRYRLLAGNIWFTPLPSSGISIRFWYVPRFTPLVGANDSFDGFNGWEEWAINDVAMKALVKEESPIDAIQALQQIQNDRLASIIENRDAGSPSTVVDVYRANGGGYGRDGEDDWGP